MNIFFARKLGYTITSNKSAAYVSLLILKTKKTPAGVTREMFQGLKGDGAIVPCMASYEKSS